MSTRTEIANLKAELVRIDRMPATAEAIRAQIEAACTAQAADLADALASFGRVASKDPAAGVRLLFEGSYGASALPWVRRLTIGLLANDLADELSRHAIAAAAEMGEAMAPAEREARLRELRRAIYALELRDVAETRAGRNAFRPDTNPAAVLGAPLDEAEDAGLI
ncbi:hypothetical protein [Thauera aromatica]|uniref:Uncharacterized protein n=1 Tax=Thauera aromatica K172 TaxID=44139 RepID=A0A2R4BQH2_THAAR|nr:hypothetical protein [Thauera aromatica]AVR89530.1 hypothetical protein Tharo_2642 [Thauera aromatica K172]